MNNRLSPEERREIQLSELMILKELDRLSREHGIRYFITAGTLLGAVRHKGFIPWDDDIDVVMTTKDYEKLRKIAKSQLSEGFFFQDGSTEKNYPYFFGKIRMDGTFVREEILDSFDIHKGQYLDIFPLDKCPDNPRAAALMFKLIQLYGAAIVSKDNPAFVLGYEKFSAKLIFGFIRRLPTPVLKTLRRMTRDFFGFFASGRRFATLAGAHGYPRESYDAEWFSDSVLLRFEDGEYPAPKEWDKLLRSMYGDYMTPPDESDREGHFIKNNNDTNTIHGQGETK